MIYSQQGRYQSKLDHLPSTIGFKAAKKLVLWETSVTYPTCVQEKLLANISIEIWCKPRDVSGLSVVDFIE